MSTREVAETDGLHLRHRRAEDETLLGTATRIEPAPDAAVRRAPIRLAQALDI